MGVNPTAGETIRRVRVNMQREEVCIKRPCSLHCSHLFRVGRKNQDDAMCYGEVNGLAGCSVREWS
jgi:hypothetical protein